jgi:hypothetical protein
MVYASQINNVIEPSSYFINHTKPLDEIDRNLHKFRKTSVIGISGIGKTQVVRTYATNEKQKYDLIWFIDCNLDIKYELLLLAKEINEKFQVNFVLDPNTIVQDLMKYLAHRNKWLLVFDNLKVGDNNKITEFIEIEHNGHIIFCSQDSSLLPHQIVLNFFNSKDAQKLATKILTKEDNNLSIFLAEMSRGYPVLTVQGAQVLNMINGLNQEEYKRKIYQNNDKIKVNIMLVLKELPLSAQKLLYKIALINNQNFSKDFLYIITDNKDTVDADIYQLANYTFLSNKDIKAENPIFEMHDIIAQKIQEINSESDNREYIEDILNKLINFVPKSIIGSHLFRENKTIIENIKIISKNAEKYQVNVNKILALNLQLLIKYVNSLDVYNAKDLILWFDNCERHNKFKLKRMKNDEKNTYAEYLAIIGGYYRRLSDYHTAVEYYIRAQEIYKMTTGYDSFKCNVTICLGKSYLALGDIIAAEKNIQISEQMVKNELIDKNDATLIDFAKARLLFMQAKYKNSLEQTENTIQKFLQSGIKKDDGYLAGPYMLRAQILNILGRYQDSMSQLIQLNEIQRQIKTENHIIFARIFTQIAKNHLAVGNNKEAAEYISKAIKIQIEDRSNSSQPPHLKADPDLAESYVVQGDILMQNALIENSLNKKNDSANDAIKAYISALNIYINLYGENKKNVAQMSDLYLKGAKVSCAINNHQKYQMFSDFQLEDFGIEHKNTQEIIKYCKQYHMKFHNMKLKPKSLL